MHALSSTTKIAYDAPTSESMAPSSLSRTMPGSSIQIAFQGHTSSQARHRMHGSGSSIRCLGDLTPCCSHSASTVSTA